MADANEMYDAIMRELNNVVISDIVETEEEQKGLSCSVETVGIVSITLTNMTSVYGD